MIGLDKIFCRKMAPAGNFNRKHLANRGGFAVLTALTGIIQLYDRISLEYRNKIAMELVSMSGLNARTSRTITKSLGQI